MPEPFLIYTESLSGLPDYSLVGFEGVPLVSSCIVTIVSDGSAEARQQAGELANELREVLVTSGPSVMAKDLPSVRLADPTNIPEFRESGRSKLLVLVGSGDTAFSYYSWCVNYPVLLPVLPKGKAVATSFNNPAFGDIRRINAKFWSKCISEVVPAVFALVGLTTESQRVFISYRRIETQPLALQLFDALTHEGLDVFLDRFTIPPGLNFQQRLYQELAEKSMVLLLESERLSSSAWTQIEIDHCKKYRLGLYSLQMPNVSKEKAIASIGLDLRRTLDEAEFDKPPKMVDNPSYNGEVDSPEPRQVRQWQTLSESSLEDVVMELRRVHDQALFRRRRYLREVMNAALVDAGARNVILDDAGMMVVDGKQGKRYSVWLTTRPPELLDFQTTHLRTAIPPPNYGIVIGPLLLLEPVSKSRLDWLSRVSQMQCVDESQIATAALKMVEGTL